MRSEIKQIMEICERLSEKDIILHRLYDALWSWSLDTQDENIQRRIQKIMEVLEEV